MTFARRAIYRRRAVYAGGTRAGWFIQEDVTLSRQSQFKKGA
jgi:hypothetical protein